MRKGQEFPGASKYKDRHGKLRWRYRSKGSVFQLGTDYGSPEFLRRYNAAVKGERLTSGEVPMCVSQAPHGSLSHVIEGWYLSPDFVNLGPTTKKQYRYEAERLRNAHGTKRVTGLTRQIIKRLMAEKSDRPGAANNLLRMFRLILGYAVEMELLEINPAMGVKKYSTKGDGFYTWTEEDIQKFYAYHEPDSTAALAMTLMLYTGASRADVVKLGPGNVQAGRFQYSRQKMETRDGVLVDIPLNPALVDKLSAVMDRTTFLQTAYGSERTANGFGTTMRKWCDAAGLPECASHGLRKACARRLADAGASPHEIMAVTGHKTIAEVQRYTDKADRRKLADRAFKKQGDDT